ncbi:MAG TPA: SDR family NAD(P)-dependent oxidoreductase [Candidatus Dormibacteraeota bacterium]|nr:SDR family NAD(P)-dependent oxidoreductase [Candidatus Dormibacteraeota bacterium]
MAQRLDGTRVVLTGAAGGIGAAAVADLRALGARVAGIDARPADGVLMADVTDREQVREAMAAAVRELGGIDTLVNCAGIGVPQDAGDFPDEEARRVLAVNFFGAWNATAAAMPELLKSRGHVVNVLSGMAVVDLPFGAAYAASKRALEAYSNALRLEYAGRLTVTTLYPGYVRTAIHRRSLELGVSLDGVAHVETVDQAAAAVVRACVVRRRRMAVTPRSRLEFWLARHWPRLVERVVRARLAAAMAKRPAPSFLRHPQVPGR